MRCHLIYLPKIVCDKDDNPPVVGKEAGVEGESNLEDVSFCVDPGEVLNIA